MNEDSGIGKPKTLEQRVADLEHRIIYCAPQPTPKPPVSAKPRDKGKRND